LTSTVLGFMICPVPLQSAHGVPFVTPVPPQTHLPPGAIIGSCYRVQAGDTLFSIGKQFGVDPGFIAALNKLWSPHTIYVNQGLFIPDPASGGGHGPTVYIAKTGDTLDSVAQQCNLPTAFLSDVNRLPRDAALQQGHVLIIPIPPPVPVPPPPYIRPHPYPPPYCCPPPPPPCYGPKSYCY
jgi:LysM repeat protein